MSRTLENIEGYLFPEYSKRKLHCLSKTYEELARMYRDIPQEQTVIQHRSDVLYRNQIIESKMIFARHLEEISGAVEEVADTVMHVSVPVEHKRKALIQYLKKQGIIVKEMVFLEGSGAGRWSRAPAVLRPRLPCLHLAGVRLVHLLPLLCPA